MEFLVNIKFLWPDSVGQDERERLRKLEAARAAELAEAGHLRRMWRVPGRRENWGLWEAPDATELHRILTSLPIWPYMDVSVHGMAAHPVDPARRR